MSHICSTQSTNQKTNAISEKASKKVTVFYLSPSFSAVNPPGSPSEHACSINRTAGLFRQPRLAALVFLLKHIFVTVCVCLCIGVMV